MTDQSWHISPGWPSDVLDADGLVVAPEQPSPMVTERQAGMSEQTVTLQDLKDQHADLAQKLGDGVMMAHMPVSNLLAVLERMEASDATALAAQEQVAALREAIADALEDFELRDELSALDTLRAALADSGAAVAGEAGA